MQLWPNQSDRYHSSVHAADVMQAVHYFLSACNVPLSLPPPPAALLRCALAGRARRGGIKAYQEYSVKACGVQLAQYLTPMHQLVMLLGAAVHDLGHTGRFGL